MTDLHPSTFAVGLHGLSRLDDDLRPFPPSDALEQLGQALMTEVLDLVLGSPLDDHLAAIAESLIGGLHTAALRLERAADRHRDVLARALRDFDGSEVADSDLQQAQAHTDSGDAAMAALALVRDAAAAAYTNGTGETWSPWRGAVRPSPVTAGQVDAAQALRSRAARRVADADPGMMVVAFRGAPSAATPQDAGRIFDALNWAQQTWPQMTLALTGAPGADQIARRWATQKRVRLVLARPDFAQHGRAAPFRANDQLMALTPVCVLGLPASLEADDGKAFGPVLQLMASARAAGVRCVKVRRR